MQMLIFHSNFKDVIPFEDNSHLAIVVCCITLFHAGGHRYHSNPFFGITTWPRRLQVYSKFKFRNYRTPKNGLVSKKICYCAWEAAKIGWVVDFLLQLCLKIGCNFNFHEIRWTFLTEIKLQWPQILKQKIKTCSHFICIKN